MLTVADPFCVRCKETSCHAGDESCPRHTHLSCSIGISAQSTALSPAVPGSWNRNNRPELAMTATVPKL